MATTLATDPNLEQPVDHHRDQPGPPAALVRYLENKPDTPYWVVRWAPNPADRRLFEYFRSLEMADMAVTFIDGEPDTGPPASPPIAAPTGGASSGGSGLRPPIG